MFAAVAETLIGTTIPNRPACNPVEPKLSRYRIIEQLGQGGMGVVYLAVDQTTGRQCAVKVMRPDRIGDPASEARFELEIDALRQLSHPNIVRLLDDGTTADGARYFAMEHVTGDNLENEVRRNGPLASQRVRPILRHICRALAEAHAQGFIHRDIKPANIIASGIAGRCNVVKLVDFGLAHCDRTENHAALSITDSFAGSPLYSSPESYAGEIDHRSDIYSLGATAFYLLTGRPVFDEDQPLAAIAAHAERAPFPVQCFESGVDAELDAIVMKCLHKDPAERFQSVEELDEALGGDMRLAA